MTASFTRQTGQARKRAFVEATINCLAEHGYHGTSVRKIAAAAGVTPGLLTHYYSGKEELIADAYRHSARMTRNHAMRSADSAGEAPQDRFRAFVAACFTDPPFRADLFRVWLNFWVSTLTEPQVRKAHAQTYGDFRKQIGRHIDDLLKSQGRSHPPDEVEALAIGVNAIIDGLWLERGLDPATFNATQAINIVYRFVGSTLNIDFAPSNPVKTKDPQS